MPITFSPALPNYIDRRYIAFEKFASLSMALILGGIALDSIAAPSITTEHATKIVKKHNLVLAPFQFNMQAQSERDNDIGIQKNSPVCKDILTLLNKPRSNDLFKTDGTVQRETESIKSVAWETLNKDTYRNGYGIIANNYKGQAQQNAIAQYENSNSILQRTFVYPNDSHWDGMQWTKKPWMKRWLYRIVSNEQYAREYTYANPKAFGQLTEIWSGLQLLTSFPDYSESWFGDDAAKPYTDDRFGIYTGHVQWIEYQGEPYAINHSVLGDVNKKYPKALNVDVIVPRINAQKQSVFLHICAFSASYKK